MTVLRYLLFPVAGVYGAVIFLRNALYDVGYFTSQSYDFPIICVGNVSVGGTGKTPMIEYLVRVLSPEYKVGTLSRGYKRQSKGFYVADFDSTAALMGDEPFQFASKFPQVVVAVDADRRNGILQLQERKLLPQVLLLDDAFQHRKVQPGFSILLTAFDSLYVDDWLLPVGTLRDTISQVKRAQIIVVTKSPTNLSIEQAGSIRGKLRVLPHQLVLFATIPYSDMVMAKSTNEKLTDFGQLPFTLVTGIANPTPLVKFLEEKGFEFTHINFPDHHHFSEREINDLRLHQRILTTEKDFMRLKDSLDNVSYLPIENQFIWDEDKFKDNIIKYVKEYS